MGLKEIVVSPKDTLKHCPPLYVITIAKDYSKVVTLWAVDNLVGKYILLAVSLFRMCKCPSTHQERPAAMLPHLVFLLACTRAGRSFDVSGLTRSPSFLVSSLLAFFVSYGIIAPLHLEVYQPQRVGITSVACIMAYAN